MMKSKGKQGQTMNFENLVNLPGGKRSLKNKGNFKIIGNNIEKFSGNVQAYISVIELMKSRCNLHLCF